MRLKPAHLLFVGLALVYTLGMAMTLALLAPAHAQTQPSAQTQLSAQAQLSAQTLAQTSTTENSAIDGDGATISLENLSDAVVALVNQRPIARMSVDNVARQLAESGNPASDERILDELINLEVLTQAAEAQKLDTSPDVAAALQLQYNQTMANAYLSAVEQSLSIEPAALREAYENAIEDFNELEFRAAHILLESESDARQILAELLDGREFATVATENSIDSTADQGGDLGWFDQDTMPAEFFAAVNALAIGDMTREPVQTRHGWHVIRLLATRPAAPPPYNALRTQLRMQLVQRELATAVAALREAASIERR